MRRVSVGKWPREGCEDKVCLIADIGDDIDFYVIEVSLAGR